MASTRRAGANSGEEMYVSAPCSQIRRGRYDLTWSWVVSRQSQTRQAL